MFFSTKHTSESKQKSRQTRYVRNIAFFDLLVVLLCFEMSGFSNPLWLFIFLQIYIFTVCLTNLKKSQRK